MTCRRLPLIGSPALLLAMIALGSIASRTIVAQAPVPFAPSIDPSLLLPKTDPLPIQRVLVPAGRVPIELERARKGTLVQLSRAEFEARVRLAAEVEEALSNPPRLLETSYRAVLDNEDLVGTGQWVVSNPNARAGILPLAGLNLALRRCRTGDTDAVIGDLDGKSLGLLVEKRGKQTIALDWSARGSPGPEGIRFELKVPSCALTRCELDLPADRSLLLSQEAALVIGPLPGPRPDRKTWQIHCAGWTQLDLLIRRDRGPEPTASMILARIQTRQEISPLKTEAEFDISLDVLHQRARQLDCVCEGDFHATAVVLRNLEINTWRFQPATNDRPALLSIQFPEPLEGTAIPLRIKGLSPFPGRTTWNCAGIRPVGATIARESLTLRFDSELAIDDWLPGRFDLLKTSTDKGGIFVLSLQSGTRAFDEPSAGVKTKGQSTAESSEFFRPRARLRLRSSACNVRQYSAWRLAVNGESFKTEMNYQVLRGPIGTLPIRIAAAWTVDKVELAPQGQLGTWELEPGEGEESILHVHLEQRQQPGTRLKLALELRPGPTRAALPMPGNTEAKRVALAFPYAAPAGVDRLESILEIGADPIFQITEQGAASARPASVDALIAQAFARPQWSIKQPTFTFAQQELPVTGILEIAPRAPEARAQGVVETPPPTEATTTGFESSSRIPTVRKMQRITTADPLGKLTSRFDFELNDWPERLLPLRLPPECKLITGSVDRLVMDRLAVDELPDRWSEVHLPVPAGPRHHYEIWYESQENAALLHSTWTVRLPILPLSPDGFRQRWCLPDGVTPSDPELLQPIPRWTAPTGFAAQRPGRNTESLQLILRNAMGRLRDDRRAHAEGWRLGDLLNRLDFELSRDGECMVIDVDALQQANLTPATTLHAQADLANSFDLREVGLLAIPAESSFLLTTLRDAGDRGLVPAEHKALSKPLGYAIEFAATHGRDSSGCYQRCSDWVSRAAASVSPERAGDRESTLTRPTGWTEWEALPETPSETAIAVCRSDVITGVRVFLGMIFFVAGCVVPLRSNRGRIVILLVAGILILGAASWLPSPFAGLVPWALYAFLLALGLRWIILRRAPKAKALTPPLPASAAFIVALLLVFSLPAVGAPSSAHTVWLVRSGASPQKWAALASPDLIEQLEALAQRGARGLQGSAVMAAEYESSVVDGSVSFSATFRLHTFSRGDSLYNLPLSGVDLLDATLDGNAAYPITTEVPPTSYQFRIQGAGNHRLQVRFSTRLQGDGGEASCRLGTPEVLQSHLRFQAPPGASYLHVVHSRGAQSISSDAQGEYLSADLGNGNGIELSWHQANGKKADRILHVQEAHYWDLQSYFGRLLSVFQFSVIAGAPPTLEIAIPETMEVRRVEAAAFPAGGRTPHLRQWRLEGTGEKRTLRLDFQVPVSAGVQISLELVPRTSFSRDTVLAVPAPLNAECEEGLLAFRVEGQGVTPVEYQRITGIPAEVFTRRWQAAGTEDPGTPDWAFSFRRSSGSAPVLRLGLVATRAPARYSQDIVWRLSPGRTDVRATAKLTRLDQDINMVEWLLPEGMAVEELSGANVRSWSRSNKAIQIWLDHSVGETRLELHGNLRRDPQVPERRFLLPHMAIASAQQDHTLIRVLCDTGHALVPVQVTNLAPLPETVTPRNQRSYVTRDLNYSGLFDVLETPVLRAGTLATIGLENGRCFYKLRLTISVPDEQPRSIVLQLRGWKGQNLRIAPPHGCALRPLARAPGIRSWLLEPITTHPGIWQLDLTGSFSLLDRENRYLPTVELDGAEIATATVVVLGSDLTLQPAHGIVSVPVDDKLLGQMNLAAAELHSKGGSLWRVPPGGPPVELNRRPELGRKAMVLHEEHRAALGYGGRWTHEALFRILASTGTDLTIRLPEHAELIRSAVDGGETVLGRPANGDYTLRLTSRTSMQSLLLVWRYEDGTEDEHAPRLEEPNLFRRSEESSASATWKVLIPPGNRPEVVEGRAIVGAEVGVILRQATAELDAYRNAFEGIDPQEPPAAALLREIDGLCRKADALLRVRQVRMSLGSYAEILSTRLRELVETRSELAGKKHLDSPTRPIRDLEDWPTEPGLPTYLERTGPTAPVLQLVPENSAQKTSEPMVAILFLGVCLLSAGLSIFPAVRKSLECFGPEMAMVLGIIGWQMVGFSGLALIPLMLGITARLIDIYRWSLSFVYRAV